MSPPVLKKTLWVGVAGSSYSGGPNAVLLRRLEGVLAKERLYARDPKGPPLASRLVRTAAVAAIMTVTGNTTSPPSTKNATANSGTHADCECLAMNDA